MGLPLIEQIAVDIFNTVSGVTVDNGYNFDLTVQRHSKSGDKIAHLNTVIVQDDPHEAGDPVYFTKEWIQPFDIAVFIIPLESDPTAIDTYVNVVRSDVEKALMVDRYRGGKALDTQIRACRNVSETLDYDCIAINVEVTYRTLETNPYVKVD
jgi:hypothetical protein